MASQGQPVPGGRDLTEVQSPVLVDTLLLNKSRVQLPLSNTGIRQRLVEKKSVFIKMYNLREGKTPQLQANFVQKKTSCPRTMKSIQKSLPIFICSLKLRSRQLSGFSLSPWSPPVWGWGCHHHTACHAGGPGLLQPLQLGLRQQDLAPTGSHEHSGLPVWAQIPEGEKSAVQDHPHSAEVTEASYRPPLGHVSLVCGLEHRAQPWHEPPPNWVSKGKEKGQISALPLFQLSRPQILCAPEASSFPIQSRLFLARLAGQRLLPPGPGRGRRAFPPSVTLTILVQTLCEASSCTVSAWGGKSVDTHCLALLPGQRDTAMLACLPFTQGTQALPRCLGGFLWHSLTTDTVPISGWEQQEVQWLGALYQESALLGPAQPHDLD